MSSNTTSKDPQNPHTSLLVSASAGSGKTYQLSRRFIQLVGAHTDPAKILTITFTIKAAHELRTRILNLASKLLINKQEQLEYEKENELHHYDITPYNYRPQVAVKITPKDYHDLGQGLIDQIYDLEKDINDNNKVGLRKHKK